LHPGLAAHPFVQHVEALGIEVAHEGITNAYGYTERAKGAWFHAVDLVCEMWRELIETQDFTDPASIFRAIVYGCCHSHHENKAGKGYLATSQARHIMRELGACEPDDRAATIHQFGAPSLCKQDSGSEYWPINIGPGIVAEDQAWAIIHGIEDGWFAQRPGWLPAMDPAWPGSLHRRRSRQLHRNERPSRIRVLKEIEPWESVRSRAFT
jgi:hypothetical protein